MDHHCRAGCLLLVMAVGGGSLSCLHSDPAPAERVPPTRVLPVASAGADQDAVRHMLVTLDARDSRDPAHRELLYRWEIVAKPNGSETQLLGSDSPRPELLIDADGRYTIALVAIAGKDTSSADSVVVSVQTPVPMARIHGLDFSPYLEGQDPALTAPLDEKQIRNRMALVAPHAAWIRSFGCTHGLESCGRLAHDMGLRAAVGAWLGRDPTENEAEIANLIAEARAGHVDMAIVGSETLLRGDLTEGQLIDLIERVRGAIPDSIPVTTGESWLQLLAHPDVVAAVDVVFFNQYSYWEGLGVTCAVSRLHACFEQLTALAAGKPVVCSETGWPSCGEAIQEATPSAANAAAYFANAHSWAVANAVPLFYFSAFDEDWKAPHEGPQGACWGVWDRDGRLKPGMEAVFNGETVPDNWTGNGIVGGPGNPSIELSFVPPLGSHANLRGQARHVRPREYAVAVYIRVSGGWWTKPAWSAPTTPILCDGTWETDVTTGGDDAQATDICAFLVPATYAPPALSGQRELPADLDHRSAASTCARRTGRVH